jgi:hypothetical protein
MTEPYLSQLAKRSLVNSDTISHHALGFFKATRAMCEPRGSEDEPFAGHAGCGPDMALTRPAPVARWPDGPLGSQRGLAGFMTKHTTSEVGH